MMAPSAQQPRGVGTRANPQRGRGLGAGFYRFAYRWGRPRWDAAEPRPELTALVAGRPPGRVLDLGCGTGSDALWLAGQGWEAVGVDFVPDAISAAEKRVAESAAAPRFVVGDVTRLRDVGVEGPFDLLLDSGCYHGVPAGRRSAYAAEVAAVARPGADFYLAGITQPPATWRLLGARGVDADDLRRHFGDSFELVDERAVGVRSRFSHFVLYHLVRNREGGTK